MSTNHLSNRSLGKTIGMLTLEFHFVLTFFTAVNQGKFDKSC